LEMVVLVVVVVADIMDTMAGQVQVADKLW
jgi:hypothetical protein